MIDIQLSRNLFVPKFLPLLPDYSHRFEFYMGSAGSGKSFFITQKLIVRALTQNVRIIVCRRYGTTLRQTCFALFKDVLKQWKLLNVVRILEGDLRLQFPSGSEIIFMGLDDEAKLLSLANISCIFIEEVFEVSKDIFEQLNLRMRSQVEGQQIIASFNPISAEHWLHEFCIDNPPPELLFIHSTFRDNPHLTEDYIAQLMSLYDRNPQKARIFCDGEWGVNTDDLVYSNWEQLDFDAMALAKTCEHRAGLDFGYVDPSAVVDTLYDRVNKTIYVIDEFYKPGCQLDEIVSVIGDMHLTRTRIYCDSAEPRSIQFFRQHGINAVPCVKGSDSIRARQLFLQNHRIVVHPKCKSVINELSNFRFKRDRSGRLTEDTTHEYSHALDALGYAFSDIYTQSRLRTIDKGVLGL